MSFITTSRSALAAALFVAANAAHAQGIEVHDAYATAATPTAISGAVYMTIHNHGGAPDRLIEVSSDAAQQVMMHSNVEGDNGVMSMVPITDGLDLPTDGDISFSQGGNHIMLMGLTAPFVQEDVLSVTLIFENAGEVAVDVPVDLTRLSGDDMDQGTMDHGAMDHGAMDHGAMDHGAMIDQSGLADQDAIIAVMKAQFDTPENPLTVDPVVVEGSYALASWAQGGNGGRALLSKGDMGWSIILCGGADLRMPEFLEEHGVTASERLSTLYNAAEDRLGADRVALSSSFEGVVTIGQ